MRENKLLALWQAGRPAFNAWLSIGSGYSAEILAHLPYHAVTVDLQHGMFGFETALAMLQAISTSAATPMVRVEANQPWQVQKLLDAGAYGVICPLVDTPQECEDFVRSVHYPPRGTRSFGPSRGLLYGGPDYAARSGETLLSWAMIETAAAIGNLEAIASTDGLSGLYIGPSDLSMTLEGEVASPLSPLVCRSIDQVIEAARDHGKRVGVFCPDAAFALDMLARRCDLITVMNDAGLLRFATSSLIASLGGPEAGLFRTALMGWTPPDGI